MVEVAGAGETRLVTLVLDKGTWQIDGVAQFGEAGVSVRATQYVYVKQFKNGQPV